MTCKKSIIKLDFADMSDSSPVVYYQETVKYQTQQPNTLRKKNVPLATNKNSNSIKKQLNPAKSRTSFLTTSVLNAPERADRSTLGPVPLGVATKGASRPAKGVPVVNVNPLLDVKDVENRYSATMICANKTGPTSSLVKAPSTNLRDETEDEDLARNCSWDK